MNKAIKAKQEAHPMLFVCSRLLRPRPSAGCSSLAALRRGQSTHQSISQADRLHQFQQHKQHQQRPRLRLARLLLYSPSHSQRLSTSPLLRIAQGSFDRTGPQLVNWLTVLPRLNPSIVGYFKALLPSTRTRCLCHCCLLHERRFRDGDNTGSRSGK